MQNFGFLAFIQTDLDKLLTILQKKNPNFSEKLLSEFQKIENLSM
jgi:hypothetical protein